MATKYRLRARNGGEARRRQQGHWNGGAQGATNDSEEFKATVRIIDGYPVEYSCRDDPRRTNFNDDNVSDLSITFDYEMITTRSAGVIASTRSLEWSLLWNVARNLGLHNCNYNKQEPLFGGEERRLQIVSENYVIGLSSLDLDIIDDETAFCTFLDNPKEEGLVCTPMIGRMSAQFAGDETAVRDLLEQNIKMELNSRRVRIEQVRECRYVGDRSDMQPAPAVSEEIQSQNNTMNLALVFGVLAGVFILGIALLMAKGRRGRRTRQQHTLEDDGDSTLPNIPASVMFHKPRSNRSVRQSSSSDTQDSISDVIALSDVSTTTQDGEGSHQAPADTLPIPSTAVKSKAVQEQQSNIVEDGTDESNNDASTTDATEVHGNRQGRATELPSTAMLRRVLMQELEFGLYPAATHSEGKENGGVPPLPPLCVVPVPPVVDGKDSELPKSKTLQPRRKRRRKKKKKQRVLKRVSSRNSIDEMETIREDDESDIYDDGSEFDGSEYSTDDEGEILSWHRESNAGTEAAENGSVSSEPVIPPSPIREEPKIRRLPPPWI